METQTQLSKIEAQTRELMRSSEGVGRKRELNRILELLLKWGIPLTQAQLEELVGDALDS